MHPAQSRIELVCVLLPHEPDETEVERYDETKDAWQRAAEIAHRARIHSRFEEWPDRACTIGDGYLYPPLSLLEAADVSSGASRVVWG